MPLWFILRIEWTSEKTIQSRSGAHKIRRVQSDFSIPLMRESFLFKRQPRGFLTKSSNSDGEGNGTPLQYSCLKNPMDKGAWLAAIHGIAKSHTRLSAFTLTFHFHALKKEMATHSSVLAWRIPGMESLVGCHLWGHTDSDTIEAI